MSEKSLFFNALPDSNSVTGYDRNYNADDISDCLGVLVETGVIKNTTGLKINTSSGMTVQVMPGKAVINGKYYKNTTAKSFTLSTAPVGDVNRIDAIVLRYDNTTSVRSINLELKTGAVNNTIPALTRNDNIYELLLGYIVVTPGAMSVTSSMIKDFRGDVETAIQVKSSDDSTVTTTEQNGCPYVTAVKGYDDYYDAIVLTSRDVVTLASSSKIVQFNIPSYNSNSDIIKVYTNGILEAEANYTVSGQVVTFNVAKVAGTKVEVIVDKFLDGEGLETALANYTRLNNIVEGLNGMNEYSYMCNGVNDNVGLSNLYNSIIEDKKEIGGKFTIKVYGNFGATAAAGGSGEVINPFAWFNFSSVNTVDIVIDFVSCSKIVLPIADGTDNVVFKGEKLTIKNVHVIADNINTNTTIRAFADTASFVKCENCAFNIYGYYNSLIAQNGTFTNCNAVVTNVTLNSYCFLPSENCIIRLNGGEFRAYTKDNSVECAVVAIGYANSAAIVNGVNMSTNSVSGYYQKNSIFQIAGNGYMRSNNTITTLPINIDATRSEVTGTIPLNLINKS